MTEDYTFRKDEKGFKSFAELLVDYDFFTIFEAYAKPFYAFAKGLKEGFDYNDQEAEEFLLNLDKGIAQKDAQIRVQRMDDLNYEMIRLQYQKSAVELERMLNPSLVKVSGAERQKSSRQPKVSMNYKEYCCD
jgi:hypothetical protein